MTELKECELNGALAMNPDAGSEALYSRQGGRGGNKGSRGGRGNHRSKGGGANGGRGDQQSQKWCSWCNSNTHTFGNCRKKDGNNTKRPRNHTRETKSYANYGFHPAAIDPASTEPLNPASQVYVHWMHAVHDESRKRLEEERYRMRRYTDPARKEPPAYQVGDLVMLNGRNIETRRPSKKLDHKNHDPFQIEKIVSLLAVRLTLPRKWKIHNVFHLSLLEPYRTSEHRAPLDPSKVLREVDDIEQSEEYDVEEVMSSVERGWGNNKTILYLVKWLDCPERKDRTEEPCDNFSVGGLEKLREFHRRNPDAPRDYRLTNA